MQLGGNSLAAGAVCSRIRAALKMEHHIPVAWLMQCPTIRALARRLSDQGAAQKELQIQPLRPSLSLNAEPISSAPLTFQQVRLSALLACINLAPAVECLGGIGWRCAALLLVAEIYGHIIAGAILPALASKPQVDCLQRRLCDCVGWWTGHWHAPRCCTSLMQSTGGDDPAVQVLSPMPCSRPRCVAPCADGLGLMLLLSLCRSCGLALCLSLACQLSASSQWLATKSICKCGLTLRPQGSLSRRQMEVSQWQQV